MLTFTHFTHALTTYPQAMTAFRGGGGSGGGARGGSGAAAGEAEKRRRTAAMGKSGLQGYLTSAQDALLRGFWQVRCCLREKRWAYAWGAQESGC